jgi:hypothetical protein
MTEMELCFYNALASAMIEYIGQQFTDMQWSEEEQLIRDAFVFVDRLTWR